MLIPRHCSLVKPLKQETCSAIKGTYKKFHPLIDIERRSAGGEEKCNGLSDIFLSLWVVRPLRIVDRAALRGESNATEGGGFYRCGLNCKRSAGRN